jgi:hypothetical protein
VNKFVYWVANGSLEKWVKLPDLTPGDIIASRQIKVLLTGELERPIFTNPFFFGKEKHYLRAQIARISHSTTLVPRGLFKTDEENPKEIQEIPADADPPVRPLTVHELSKADNWLHYTQSILLNGRVSH